MIIPDSEKSESSVRGDSSHGKIPFGPVDDPPSPPPYSATIASNDDRHQDGSHSPQSTSFRPTPPAQPNLPPRCNHLVDRKTFSSVSGIWHVDTALEIPERLLPPITEFDGRWNREVQQARKAWADQLRRQARSLGSRSDQPSPLVETRPNLMLVATNGAISGDIHVVSSDGLARQATLVAEDCNGSISLRIHAPQDQLLRVFASSTNGSINIKIPSTFEGAVVISTSWGSVNISEAIKAKLTTFSSASNTSRGFVGDWQAQGFGTTTDPNNDPPLPGPRDPFMSWTGPLVDISSTNGSVNLSYIEEHVASEYASHFTTAIQGFMDGLFGRGSQNGSTRRRGHPMPPSPMFTPPHPPHPPHPPLPPFPPMFRPSPPGAWPLHPGSPAGSAGVGALDLD